MDIKQQVSESYGTNPAGFLQYADALVYSHLAVPLAEAAQRLGRRFLDVASGTGALARLLPDVIAVDLSHGQLTMNPTSRRVQADGEHLPFRAHSFDVSASAFGINHFPSPETGVAEMARVGEMVALSTWVRPERAVYQPKEVVLAIIERHLGRRKTPTGEALDRMSEAVGSEGAIRAVIASAGLTPSVWTAAIEVPWPGAEPFVDYRLSMMGTDEKRADRDALRSEAIAAVNLLPNKELVWRPEVIVAVGR